jgi:hypothetical protein
VSGSIVAGALVPALFFVEFVVEASLFCKECLQIAPPVEHLIGDGAVGLSPFTLHAIAQDAVRVSGTIVLGEELQDALTDLCPVFVECDDAFGADEASRVDLAAEERELCVESREAVAVERPEQVVEGGHCGTSGSAQEPVAGLKMRS